MTLHFRLRSGHASCGKAGICYTLNSKDMGQRCYVSDECKRGKCNNVSGGVKGEVGGKIGEAKTGHRCLAGKCKAEGMNLKCK